MLRSLYSAATGMEAQQLNVDAISNNIANVNTTGYKRSRVDFQDLLYQILKEPGSASSTDTTVPTGIQVGLGVRPAGVGKNFSQGDFQQTGNELDLAIEGKGFFQVSYLGNTAYTRASSWKLNQNGQIVTSDGFLLDPPITIPPDTVRTSVGADGTVSVRQGSNTVENVVGNIVVASFPNPAGLIAVGRNFYRESDASGAVITGTPGQDGLGTIAQGYVESSNVSVVEEMVNMIVAQRAYEANSKAITTSDEMLQAANNLKR
ncbi:MAG: flagellar basal-body rod protein FlgG [Deltaproteobacteria bacterium]|nr:flagellar basal-body rod protein FlgG [Deltaproteobacteria bacterium]